MQGQLKTFFKHMIHMKLNPEEHDEDILDLSIKTNDTDDAEHHHHNYIDNDMKNEILSRMT